MRTKLIFEGTEAVLAFQPETREERSLLDTFGLNTPDVAVEWRCDGFTGGVNIVRQVVLRRRPHVAPPPVLPEQDSPR